MNLKEYYDTSLSFGEYHGFTVEALIFAGVPEETIQLQLSKHLLRETKKELGQVILAKNSLQGLVGKLSDHVEVLHLNVARLIVAGANGSFPEVCKNLSPRYEAILSDVADGSEPLVHIAKGMSEGEVEDEARRARLDTITAIAEADNEPLSKLI